jgi:DNA polymerase alpha subunit B
MAEAELQSYFARQKPLEPDVLSELQSIQRIHDLSAEDLFLKWEAYCIKLGIEADAISLTAIRNLKQTIQDTLEKSSHARQAHPKVAATPRAGGARGASGDMLGGMLGGMFPTTPGTGAKLGKPAASALKRKMETPKGVSSSPATGMSDQLKGINGTP